MSTGPEIEVSWDDIGKPTGGTSVAGKEGGGAALVASISQATNWHGLPDCVRLLALDKTLRE